MPRKIAKMVSALPYLSRRSHRGFSRRTDAVQDLIHALKDGDRSATLRSAQALAACITTFAGVIVPVPRSSWTHPSLRHLAQALVGLGVGSRVADPVVRAYAVESSRVRRGAGRGGLPFTDHLRSLACQPAGLGAHEDLLLVDDVVTEGTTLRAVAATLRAAGHQGRIMGACIGYYEPRPAELVARNVQGLWV